MTPPILIEIQYQVNEDFMARPIRCEISVYSIYNVHPVVLVFVIKGFFNNATKEKFNTSNTEYALKTSLKFWAEECLLLSSTSISKHITRLPMDKLVALGYVPTSGALSLTALEYKSDPTVKRIYSVINNRANVTDQILEHTKRQLTSILEEEDNIEDSNITIIKNRIQEGIQFIDGQRSTLSNSQVNKKKYTEEDFIFIY